MKLPKSLSRGLTKFSFIYSPQLFCKKSRKSRVLAFTIAEILIVLGIIGIIAMDTIPLMVKNTIEMQYKIAAKKAYATSFAAVEKMRDDQGGDLLYYLSTPMSFGPIFKDYFKIIKYCGLMGCIAPTLHSTVYTSLSGQGADTHYVDDGQYITADGLFFAIENPDLGIGQPSRVYVTVDVNGYTKKPNVYGKDIFVFQLTLKNQLLPMGAPGTDYPAATYCNKAIDDAFQGFGCMENVMLDIDY